MDIFFPQEDGKSFSLRETAHAQRKCKQSNTSGRGATSYETMFPEISRWWSLL